MIQSSVSIELLILSHLLLKIIADPIENPNVGNEKCNKIELPMTSVHIANENYSLYNFSVRFFKSYATIKRYS